MPLQNRVTPLGKLIAVPTRGLVYGNRGCLHDDTGRVRRRFDGKRWIACRLRFRGWHREPLMQPGRFTELFFLDEATAFAAGHRPCALCRREDYRSFVAAWTELHGAPIGVDEIDERLHAERVHAASRGHRLHEGPIDGLPDGVFVLLGSEPYLVLGPHLLRWTPAGYGRRRRRPSPRDVLVVTPPSLVEILRGGWDGAVPFLHPSAGRG